MKIDLLFVTSDRSISTFVGQRKTALIPPDIRKKPFFSSNTVSVLSFFWSDKKDHATDFGAFLLELQEVADFIIVVCQDSLTQQLRPYLQSIFLSTFDRQQAIRGAQNHFGAILAPTMKAAALFVSKFDDFAYGKLIRLPLINFRATELTNLRAIFEGGDRVPPVLAKLETALAALRERQRPKTKSPFHELYIVDEDAKYFSLGKENHSQSETARPPHHTKCLATRAFRYGRRYEPWQHYNVTREQGEISGEHIDCHGQVHVVAARSHINMFPNDFFFK